MGNCEIDSWTKSTSKHSDDPTPAASGDHDYTVPPASTQDKLEAAQQEIDNLKRQVVMLQDTAFGLERFCDDPGVINFYTGFKNYATLLAVFNALQPTAQSMIRWAQIQRNSSDIKKIKLEVFRSESLALIDQFFLFLCRVRRGFPEKDLSVRFNVSQASVSRLLITWSNYLYCMLGCLPIWASRATIDSTMPSFFKELYPKTRVVLDCTEIKVQTPSSKVLNSETYSSYKSHTTFKSLIGITPCGAVSFVSSLYTGAIGDKTITALSGILDLLEPNDEVMADKGFLIEDLLNKRQASLVIPPFLREKSRFTAEEVKQTNQIARLRIHVERAIRRIKEYHVFDGVLPLTMAASINQIWTVCAILTNFRGNLF